MQIYNSLTKRIDELKEKNVGIYVCGPTVYDEPHIGHARSAYVFDIFVRYLRFCKKDVKFVRNITDVDDKIIERARREPGDKTLKEKVKNVALRYLDRYHEAMDLLGLERPDHEPKATNAIPEMIKFIEVLIEKGFAYAESGNVYFDVRKFKDYGKLSGQSLDETEEGVRVAIDNSKRDPLDFALWKASKDDEPSWNSPWGRGRPGWHIECSVMSTMFLKKNFVIHGGGLDLIFPHHENEIAQTVCAGERSAKYWIHNGLLTINSQKMSKSLGNFISISDFLSRFKDADLLKMLFLSSHYRHPVDYTEEKIEGMKRARERILIFMDKAREFKKTTGGKPKTAQEKATIKEFKEEFVKAMDDDFNTPEALAAIFELVSSGNSALMRNDAGTVRMIEKTILDLLRILGLDLRKGDAVVAQDEKRIGGLVKERDLARQKRDFKRADDIRNELLGEGIILEDTKDGTAWRRRL
ncbi:MAG: cysteine--tRNA ligase [Candidatus Omnitrophota bacterium]